MVAQEFLNGVEIYAEGDEAIRVSFEKATGGLDVRFGDVYMNYVTISSLPDTETINAYPKAGLSRDDYCGSIFESLFYCSLEAYVIASHICKNEPIDLLTRMRMREFMRKRLEDKFNLNVRRTDIQVVCDETNNPPSILEASNIRVTVMFQPLFGTKAFYPIHIMKA